MTTDSGHRAVRPVLADGAVAGAIGVAGALTGAGDRRSAEAAVRAVGR